MTRNLQAWAAELVGTFAFVTIGAASVIVATSQLADYSTLGVAIAHGLALSVIVSVFAATSGAHLNPAVTLSVWLGRKIGTADALGYVACQVLGSLGAGILLRVIFAEGAWRQSTLGAPALSVSVGKGVLIEAVFTFFLALAVWGTAIDERGPRLGGFGIGLTVAASILAVGPLTGAALNPARYLGPAAIGDDLTNWWVYFVGPAIGAAAAGILYPTVFAGGFPWIGVGKPGTPPPPVGGADVDDTGEHTQLWVDPEFEDHVLEEETPPPPRPVKRKPPARKKAAPRKPRPRG